MAAVASADPARKETMFKHCHEVYQKHFSKKVMLDRWADAIKATVGNAESAVFPA